MASLELVTTVSDVRGSVISARNSGKRIGLVPTMGYLHEGHLTLMRKARSECDFIVVSIFVNPTQFGPNEDFSRYPRNLDRDLALCRSIPIDLIFHPDVTEIYPQPFFTRVQVPTLTNYLCGASRPGHFEGVATVVSKLLNIVQPDLAYFGQKDAQQVAVIRQLVKDLNIPVGIEAVPTVRELDGLALSSRNVYLSVGERHSALVLSRALQLAESRVAEGERDMVRLVQEMAAMIAAEPLADVDYVSIVDHQTLQPVTRLGPGEWALAAVAVRFGRTRLIDNALLHDDKPLA